MPFSFSRLLVFSFSFIGKQEITETVKVDYENLQKNRHLEKKQRLKEQFDAEYDDEDAKYFDELKVELQKQAEVI